MIRILPLVIALVFLSSSQTHAQSTCSLVAIHCPLAGGCPTPTKGGKFQRNRVNPVTGKVANHRGVDYRGARGTEVRAAFSGTITDSIKRKDFGDTVILKHVDGKSTLYGHLLSRSVTKGQAVLAGEVIGKLDSSGRSNGHHLHLQYSGSSNAMRTKGLVDPHPCATKPAYSELVGTLRFQGAVFNNGCNKNVEVKGTVDIALRTEGSSKVEARVRRKFGPTCFTHTDDFLFASDLDKLGKDKLQYLFIGKSDTLTITFTLSGDSEDVRVNYENKHHHYGSNGVSNVGSQSGIGVIKPK